MQKTPPGPRRWCKYCRKPLPLYRFADQDWAKEKGKVWGYRGNNYFCTLRCGFKYAILAAQEIGR